MIANGGSSNNRDNPANTYSGIKTFWNDSGATSVMIARACEWNPSVFRNNGDKDDIFDVSRWTFVPVLSESSIFVMQLV